MHRIAVPHLETVNPEAGMAKPVQNQEQNNNIDDETPKDTKLSENFRGGLRYCSRRDCCGIRSYGSRQVCCQFSSDVFEGRWVDVPIFCVLKPVAAMAYEV